MVLHLRKIEKKQKQMVADPRFSHHLPFQLKGGMPCFEVDLEGGRLVFGLDSSAESNLIEASRKDDLQPCLQDECLRSFRDVSQRVRRVPAARVGDVSVGELVCRPMQTLFVDLDATNYHLPGKNIDGILGFEFIKQFKIAINFRQKVIALEPHHSDLDDKLAASE